MAKITGETMNKVYEELKTMTIDQIKRCKDGAYTKFRTGSYYQRLFMHQCDFAIEKKQNGEW